VASPTTSVLQDFNVADANPYTSATWVTDSGTGFGTKVVSNELANANGTDGNSGSSHQDTLFGNSQEVFATMTALPTGGNKHYLKVCIKDSTRTGPPTTADGFAYTGYQLAIFAGSWNLERRTGGSDTSLTSGTRTNSAGEKWLLQKIGSNFTVSVFSGGSWSELGSTSDSTYTDGGYLVCDFRSTGTRIDDFGGGDVVGTSYIPILSVR
jgi:hypothetical protein